MAKEFQLTGLEWNNINYLTTKEQKQAKRMLHHPQFQQILDDGFWIIPADKNQEPVLTRLDWIREWNGKFLLDALIISIVKPFPITSNSSSVTPSCALGLSNPLC